MIASVLSLTRNDCEKLKITDPYSIHRVVYDLFPPGPKAVRNFLFRDKGEKNLQRQILMLSEDYPSKPLYGDLESKVVPEKLLDFSQYGFDVLVNPVYRDNKTGVIIPIKGKESLELWFTEKSASYGFFVMPRSLVVSETDVLRFAKKGQRVVLGKARFTGILKVTDRALFKKAFCHGLGRGKSFGFGLLELLPLLEASVDASNTIL